MSDVRTYSSDPGDDVLLGNGPGFNVIESTTRTAKNARGRGILGLVGAVVNDRGQVNEALVLENGLGDLYSRYGGFKAWLGDGLASAQAGATSGYEGNLAAHCKNLSVPVARLVIPDLAVKDATYATGTNILVSLTRSDAANGEVTVPAGTRIKAAGGYTVATLEDLYWGATETGSKTVRIRQASDTGVTAVDISTVDTFVDTIGDANITVNTVATDVPDLMDDAELILRYEAAFNAINNGLAGQQITVIACDRQEATICDDLSTHCATSKSAGFSRVCVVAPPQGTAAADARTGTNGADRAGLSSERAMVAHPGLTRSFPLDSDSLTGPAYTATFPSAIVLAARVVQSRPEENPSTAHQVFKTWGATGLEALSGGQPDLATHWNANICQPRFERTTSGTMECSFYDGQMASGTKAAVRRMRDYLSEALIISVKPFHKAIATVANRDSAVNACIGLLSGLSKATAATAERIAGFIVTSVWDATTNHLRIKCVIALLGNLDNITLEVDASTSNVDVLVLEAA